MSKNTVKIGLVVLMVSLVEGLAFAQLSALEKPAANLTEKWGTNSSGWITSSDSGGAICGWTNGSMVINCLQQTLGSGFQGTFKLIARSSASGGIFLGDYSKIEAVSFEANLNGVLLSPRFYFQSTSGNVWSFPVMNLCENGRKSAVTIPLVNSSNWQGYKGADFNSDKSNITEVGFEFIRGQDALSPQDFSVDNFKLVGPWGGPWSNGVPLAWVMEYGLTNGFATVGLADNDGDGYSNTAEFLAGTSPIDSNSFFKIEIARNSAGKMVVKWNGNRDVNYELREANSPNALFSTKTNISPTTVKVQEIVVDQNDSDKKFFKVSIQSKN